MTYRKIITFYLFVLGLIPVFWLICLGLPDVMRQIALREGGGVQPAGRGPEVLVGHAGAVGGTDAAVKPTWRYSRPPLA